MPLSDPDYYTFESFVRAVLTRVSAGHSTVVEGKEDIMHPFTALDKGNEAEFVPWMQAQMDKWERERKV